MKAFIISILISLVLFNACKEKPVEPVTSGENSWEKVSDLPGYPNFIKVKDNKIYMVYYSSDYKFAVSEDTAKSWQEYNLDFQIRHEGFLNVDGDTFFISSVDGLYRSFDGGVTWKEDLALRNYINPTFSIPSLTSIVVDDNNIYLGQLATGSMSQHVRGILFSSDNGQNWSSPSGLPSRVVDIAKIGQMVVFINFKVHYSTDNLNTCYDAAGIIDHDIVRFVKTNSRLYGIGYRTIKYSDNYGVVWESCTNGLPTPESNYLFLQNTFSFTKDKLFILDSNGIIHYSNQTNLAWKEFDSNLPAFNPFPYENQSLFTIGDDYLYYRSENKLWRKKISD